MPPLTRLDDAALTRVLDPVPTVFDVPQGMRAAAVFAPFFRKGGAGGEDYLLLLQRRRDLRHHGGEVAFPGGRREHGETPLACALREMEEEVGIAGEEAAVLGSLPSMPSLAGFHVQALVGRIPAPRYLRIDAHEIEAALEIPVVQLSDRGRWQMRIGPGARRPSPHFQHQGRTVWGLTAWFVQRVLERAGAWTP